MFGRRRGHQAKDSGPQEAVGSDLRQMVLDLHPAELGLSSDSADSIFGFVMDTSFDDGDWFTLVCLQDGTVSLYTSGTFGVIGAGEHPHIRAAAAQLLDLVQQESASFTATRSRNLPEPGMVTLRALTPGGHLQVTALEADLGEDRHPASPLFHAAHEVITLVRRAAEAGPRS